MIKVFKVGKNEKKTVVITEGGNYEIQLIGEGAKVDILGIFIGSKSKQFSINTKQHHKSPNTTSDLLIKSVLFDESSLNYDGLIKIEKEGQGSDAYQRNENLMMSSNARVNTKPELEILANSVRCTHGATVGKIDREQIFYLRSRGLTEKLSETLIIEGFFEGVLERIEDHRLKKKLRDKINKSLSYGKTN